MPEVFVSIGSNIDAVRNAKDAIRVLGERYGAVTVSRLYESKPVGFDGGNFINLVARFETGLPLAELVSELRRIEHRAGRIRTGDQDRDPESRTLDIDILLYGELVGNFNGIELPRPEITTSAHVLLPLTELIGDRTHPGTGFTYSELWARFDRPGQSLWPVESKDSAE